MLYILCMFILLFSAVNPHGNLFVRYPSYISSKDRVIVVCPHVKPQRASVAIVWQKETGFIATVATDIHRDSRLRRALSIENDFRVSPCLPLQCQDKTEAARVWLH